MSYMKDFLSEMAVSAGIASAGVLGLYFCNRHISEVNVPLSYGITWIGFTSAYLLGVQRRHVGELEAEVSRVASQILKAFKYSLEQRDTKANMELKMIKVEAILQSWKKLKQLPENLSWSGSRSILLESEDEASERIRDTVGSQKSAMELDILEYLNNNPYKPREEQQSDTAAVTALAEDVASMPPVPEELALKSELEGLDAEDKNEMNNLLKLAIEISQRKNIEGKVEQHGEKLTDPQ